MLTDLELMNIQVSALFTQDAKSHLLFINEPDNVMEPAPRLFLGRTRAGNVWRFRADLPESICDELNVLCVEELSLMDNQFAEPPCHLETYMRILERDAPVEKPEMGPAYYFSQDPLSPSKSLVAVTEKNAEILQGGFDEFVSELPAWQPFVALVEETRAVSICRSARITNEAHEAGVETLPEFRGKGYAQEVVAEWALLVRAAGAIPMYSTSWENKASQAVARKLNLKFYGVDFQIF